MRPTFQQLYEAELDYVWGTLRRLGVPGADLRDLTHDVFVVVYSRLSEYDASRPLRPWIFGVVFRVVVGFRRRRIAAGKASDVPVEELVSRSAGPEEAAASSQERELVVAALAILDFDRRTVLVMHDLDGFAVPEIARTIGIPLNTAYSRLRLAREDFIEAVRRVQSRGGRP